jgi:predicted HicB family RNase H-like nuclease
MKKHGNTDNKHAQIGPENRSARVVLLLPPSLRDALDASAEAQGISRNEAAVRKLAELVKQS